MFGFTAHRVRAANDQLAGFFGHTHLLIFAQVQWDVPTLNEDQTAVIQVFTAFFMGRDGPALLLGHLKFALNPIALFGDQCSDASLSQGLRHTHRHAAQIHLYRSSFAAGGADNCHLKVIEYEYFCHPAIVNVNRRRALFFSRPFFHRSRVDRITTFADSI